MEVTSPQVRELAMAWHRDLDVLAREMYEFLAARIPEASEDEEIAGLTLASCASNIEAVLSMIRHGIPASATEAPVTALEHARKMAGRGASIDAVLRFYRLGHAYFWERWSAALVEAMDDREQLVTALRETAAFVFDYIDLISARVSAEHVAERERRQRRAAAVRADVVRAILAGDPVDETVAERALGYRIAGPQLGFVCWTTGDPAGLERAAAAIAQRLATGRPLVLAEASDAVAGWFAVEEAPDDDAIASLGEVLSEAAPEVHVALGAPGDGVDGLRTSRLGADRARRVVELARTRPPTVTRSGDVALVDLLTSDLERARAFVAEELGGLAARDAASARVRDALLHVVAPSGGIAAASRALGIHRNTVLQRVRRAEEARGRPVDERPAELHAALVLAHELGDAVLPGD